MSFVPIPEDVLYSLEAITGDPEVLNVKQIEVTQHEGEVISTYGSYFMEESELPRTLSKLLHGRAYIVDREIVTTISPGSPKTFYIAANKTKGLIVPGRNLFIEAVNGIAHYRWTDDGSKWTEWTTIPANSWHAYRSDELCRFAELQVHVDILNDKVTIRVTR